MLYKFFIDDSGQKEYLNPYSRDIIDNPPLFKDYEKYWRDNYFVLAGVRIKQENIGDINSKINKLKREYFNTHKVEVKSDWLRNPHQRKKHYLKPFKMKPEKLNEFGNKFVEIIENEKQVLKIIAVVFDKRYYGDAKRQQTEGNPLLKTTQVLFERLQYTAGYTIVVFDQMESSLKLTKGQHSRILKVFNNNEGMEKIFVNNYDTISDIKFRESSKENFLQIADICAYNIFRQFVEHGREWCGENEKDGKLVMESYDYFDKIRCNFYYNTRTGQVRGYGLSCLPDTNKINWNLLDGCFNKKTPS